MRKCILQVREVEDVENMTRGTAVASARQYHAEVPYEEAHPAGGAPVNILEQSILHMMDQSLGAAKTFSIN